MTLPPTPPAYFSMKTELGRIERVGEELRIFNQKGEFQYMFRLTDREWADLSNMIRNSNLVRATQS